MSQLLTTAIINLAAKAISCSPASLNEDSGLSRHPQWDSLGHLAIMSELESTYGFTVDESNVMELTPISDIVCYLEQHGYA